MKPSVAKAILSLSQWTSSTEARNRFSESKMVQKMKPSVAKAILSLSQWTSSTEARNRFSESKMVQKMKPSVAKAMEGEGGAGGSRTRVQTWKSYAFYMLISA